MSMDLTTAQRDRAAGVLLGQACGDALGVPYEFATPPGAGELAEMKGGGLGNFRPGEWSADTAMATAVAEGLLAGSYREIARRFLEWHASNPPDIGVQTRAVIGDAYRRIAGGDGRWERAFTDASAAYAERHAHSAGNGALMRTSPVALAFLDDRETCTQAARLIASLTHADVLAGDSCVLWSEAIRIAVLEGRLDVKSGLDLVPDDRRDDWERWIEDAESLEPATFNPNGFTVHAFQAALAAVTQTPIPEHDPGKGSFRCGNLQDALHTAVRIGDDTDTVAAIAGGLLGALWGASAVPWQWRAKVHGWPTRNGRDLISTATLLTTDGRPDPKGWPLVDDVPYTEHASPEVVPHPHDDRVLLGTHASRSHGATAVVSMCRVGRHQACFDGAEVIVESRLMDAEDPEANRNLHFALWDAADAVRALRRAGHTVMLHCVAAEQRTPSVAVAYSIMLGHSPEESRRVISEVLKSTRGRGAVWEAAGELGA
jgi:ADP-ribosylglycohydrolase